ncbi:Do family serine endopeptidase [Fretibacter rubidus]|uniref:Do family serine endopeptidase n=1 Tax=Fretibacter rubidus TaxID=570162 RepID=UPI00352B4D52
MRKLLLLGTASVAMIIGTATINSPSADAQSFLRGGDSQALTVDSRGVLTMAPLLERVTPAVVSIETAVKITNRSRRGSSAQMDMLERFFGELPEGMRPDSGSDSDDESDEDLGTRRNSIGSGVIVDAGDGYIVTNHHVIKDADEIFVVLQDRRELEAELVGSDSQTDIAVLKVKASGLKAIPFADSESVKVGDYTVAIGNPFGLGHTVTQGIVSAKGREFGRRSADQYQDFIQTDASINPGNSGGALINSKGELIGINTAIVSRSGGNNGIGFAVPARMAKSVMGQLIENGEVRRGRIGVLIQNITPDLREALDLSTSDGALVSNVVDDSPADKAGLKDGDIIVEFNNERIIDSSDIRNAVSYVEPGERASITYLRDGKRRTTRIDVEMVEEEDRDVLTADAAEDIPAMESFSGATLTDIPESVKTRGGDEGVYVSNVTRGSKAARAGLARGDIIREVDRSSVADLSDFEDAIRDKDGAIALTVERNGQTTFMAVR